MRRAVDPSDTVRNDLLRRRGVLTQADVQQVRRAVSRVGTLGDTPHHDLEGPLNVTGDVTISGPNDDTSGLLLLDRAALNVARDGTQTVVVFKGDGTSKVLIVDTTNSIFDLVNTTDLRMYTDDRSTLIFEVNGTNGHVIVGGDTPSIAAGAAAGTGPTVAVVGNDTAGRIQVTTGTAPATGTLCTVTFAHSYGSNTPTVVLGNVDSDAAAGATKVYVNTATITATTFDLAVTGSALPASTSHFWTYHCLGR